MQVLYILLNVHTQVCNTRSSRAIDKEEKDEQVRAVTEALGAIVSKRDLLRDSCTLLL